MEGYSVYKVIGEGSFGRALLVQCKNTQEKYIVKEIQLPKNESKVEKWRREAVLLSTMKHPNIVAFREAFEADHLLCIVMEYCSGGDMLQRIQQQKTSHFCVDNILKWFAEMCAGTKHIHDKRVLHRDLKSKNIFLTDKGTVKLGDFGSACVLNSSKAYACTYVGTPYYVAPEIWENKPYNNKSDVWSLGCVLYELCTLRHPFQAPSWKSLILKVCRGAYPPLPKHLPYELQLLLRQMFKTDPKDRPSLRTILTSHRASRLLRAHLSPQVIQAEERGRCSAGRPDTDERKKVLQHLGEKSLIDPMGGLTAGVEAHHEKAPLPRRRWAAEPSETVLQVFANASLQVSEESGQRKQWRRDPPERLLSLLEKAEVNRAFSTFVIHREGDSPLMGPLSRGQGDNTDGPEQEVHIDDDRLQPRSDDEDTDFEEEWPCDWMGEVEGMLRV
ncbi:serine/threonine-protein kinase Nek3 isoform X2 [Dunckerocampus dactyliophorus]|uniref:serine/threonine-protein kinase Nek3 isoform X2 n=1 Tax=Dunckerocampus dactyliophorus TaxID=161453 RepID=UPI0024062BB7|nr:serine/threonine-protein kinase Nek3 isoform X2 [Dunckerocampus dactyliophorus]